MASGSRRKRSRRASTGRSALGMTSSTMIRSSRTSSRIIAERTRARAGLVEKDYWVTHVLWALHELGLRGLVQGRNLAFEGLRAHRAVLRRPGPEAGARGADASPPVPTGRAKGPRRPRNAARSSRARHDARSFRRNERRASTRDRRFLAHTRTFRVDLPGATTWQSSARLLRPFVLLEVGHARVHPLSRAPEFLRARAPRWPETSSRVLRQPPEAVSCVHPLVTLLEKLDALHRRVPNEKDRPGRVRSPLRGRGSHDPRRMRLSRTSTAMPTVGALAEEMLAESHQIAVLPRPTIRPSLSRPGSGRERSVRPTRPSHRCTGGSEWIWTMPAGPFATGSPDRSGSSSRRRRTLCFRAGT